jgi:hypothetical protein
MTSDVKVVYELFFASECRLATKVMPEKCADKRKKIINQV